MADDLASQFLKKASPRLKKAITEVQNDLKYFKGKSISEILKQKNITKNNTADKED